MKSHIFREYDIRAVVDREISLDEVTLLGRALGTYLGREGKKGSPWAAMVASVPGLSVTIC